VNFRWNFPFSRIKALQNKGETARMLLIVAGRCFFQSRDRTPHILFYIGELAGYFSPSAAVTFSRYNYDLIGGTTFLRNNLRLLLYARLLDGKEKVLVS